MKTYILFLYFFVCYYTLNTCNAQSNNTKAIAYYKQHLDYVKSYVCDGNRDVSLMTNTTRMFGELTGLYSDSDINYFGQWNPSEIDLEKWKEWLNLNQSRLYWDNKKNKIMMYN